MIHKVRSALRGVPYLPSLGQLAQCLWVHLQVAVPRVVPCAGARLAVNIVHLALRCHPLLCRRDREGQTRDGGGMGGSGEGGGADEGWGRRGEGQTRGEVRGYESRGQRMDDISWLTIAFRKDLGLEGFPSIASSRRVHSLGSGWVWRSAARRRCCNDAGCGRVGELLCRQCLPSLLCPHHLVPRPTR